LNAYRNVIIWILIAILMILMFNVVSSPKKTEKELSYSDLLSQIQAGEVAEVTIKENSLTGRLNDGSKFKTYLWSMDVDLPKVLKEKNVRIFSKPPDQSPWYVNFFFTW